MKTIITNIVFCILSCISMSLSEPVSSECRETIMVKLLDKCNSETEQYVKDVDEMVKHAPMDCRVAAAEDIYSLVQCKKYLDPSIDQCRDQVKEALIAHCRADVESSENDIEEMLKQATLQCRISALDNLQGEFYPCRRFLYHVNEACRSAVEDAVKVSCISEVQAYANKVEEMVQHASEHCRKTALQRLDDGFRHCKKFLKF